ncbi:class I adenylate-forming enzyme family protein [Ferrovibrio terrae]|uniref:class I adenylate-forming enzyme family protein n=1 Tax=Ferrovibrio terrae TaxID=2594003 RepID=UPI00313795A4
MAWQLDDSIAIRNEAHFGDRVVRCFTDRPVHSYDIFARTLAAHPDNEALVAGDNRLTYRQLAAESDAVAGGLAAAGVKAGDRVGMLLGNRIEFVSTLLACLRLGAICVPLGTRLQTPEIAYILDHAGACLLVHEADLADRLPGAADLPQLRHRYAAGGHAPGSLAFDTLRQAGTPPAFAAPAEEATGVILYTSGTTGRPKGAMLAHINIVHSALHFQYCMGLGPDDRSLLAVPASHVTGLIAIIVTAWQGGGAVIMVPEFKARDFLPLAARERLTHTIMVPAMYNLCLLQPDFDRHDLSSWRVGGYGGAPMPQATIAALAQKLPQLGLMNAYGATETTSPTTMMPPALSATHSDSVGLEAPCAEVIVVDADGREVPPGEAGEIWIRGPMVVPGYWANPEATQQNFTAGFWHSGDIGSIDADGFVRVFDRVKDMINRGGYKIFSVEVENVLSHHPGVLESAIIARPCPVLGERVHAFVARKDAALTETVLKDFCASRLADYKVPETFTLLDEPLPRNANGKLLKRALREQLL